MEITLNTYSKLKIAYRINSVAMLLSFVLMLVGILFLSDYLEGTVIGDTIFIYLAFYTILSFISFLILPFFEFYNPAILDGYIVFSGSEVIIEEKTYSLDDIKSIRIEALEIKGTIVNRMVSDGLGNYIEIKYNDIIVKTKFIINNTYEQNILKSIVQLWKEHGLTVIAIWRGF